MTTISATSDPAQEITAPGSTSDHALANWLRCLVALSILVPLAVYLVVGWQDRQRILHEAVENTIQTTAVLYEHALKVFEAQDLVLRLVDERINDMSWDEIAGSESLHRFLGQLNPQFRQVDSVWVIDPSGTPRASSRTFPARSDDVSFRDYFLALRERDEVYVGEVYAGRLSGANLFVLAKRRSVGNGDFDGVITAAVPVNYLESFYASVEPGYDRVINLTRADGILLVRDPPAPGPVTFAPDSSFMHALADNPRQGIFESRAVLDGVQRIFAFRKVGDYPVYVVHGVGKQAVLADWRRNLVQYGIVALAASLMLSTIAFLAYRRAQSQAAHQIALRRANESLEDRVRQRTLDLSASEERFRHLANAVPAFVWVAMPDGQITFLNERWFNLTGLTIHQSLGSGWRQAIHPDDQERCLVAWGEACRHNTLFEIEIRIRDAVGNFRWYIARAEPSLDAEGQVSRWFGTSTDIHDRREAQDRLQLLVNELNHRVKNTLAAVQSVAQQTLRSSPAPQDFSKAFDERLMALSRAHDILTREAWSGALIGDVAQASLAPFGAASPERFTIAGPVLRLSTATAVSLSMALHELGTNAAKYGALSAPDGRVSLTWAVTGTNGHEVLTLNWVERGGPPTKPPSRQGFGVRLIERGLAHQFNGKAEIVFEPEGVRATIEISLVEATPKAAELDLATPLM